MEHLHNVSPSPREPAVNPDAVMRPNLCLLSSDELPPILFTPDQVSRMLGIARSRVFDLIRQRRLRSVKVGGSRRISARALHDYVTALELEESA
ncbi:MAG: helix-turn-helix domain-containing protein [Actinomycetota bacterium]|nr:helix-turn-helix domain-containing protein [Actinomycetota bacterium]